MKLFSLQAGSMRANCAGLRPAIARAPSSRAPSSPSLLHQRTRGGGALSGGGVGMIGPISQASTRLFASAPDSADPAPEPGKKKRGEAYAARRAVSEAFRLRCEALRTTLIREGVSEENATSIVRAESIKSLPSDAPVEASEEIVRLLKARLGFNTMVTLLQSKGGLGTLFAGVLAWLRYLKIVRLEGRPPKGSKEVENVALWIASVLPNASPAILSEGPGRHIRYLKREVGVKKVAMVIKKHPPYLGYEVGTVDEKIRYLRDMVGGTRIGKLLEGQTQLLSLSAEQRFKPHVAFFKHLGLTKEQIADMIVKSARSMLGSSLLSHIAPCIIIYRDRFTAAGKSPSDLAAFLAKNPTVLGGSPLELPIKLDFFERELGLSIFATPDVCHRPPKAIYVRVKILRIFTELRGIKSIGSIISASKEKILGSTPDDQRMEVEAEWDRLEKEFDDEFGPTFAALRGPNGKHLPPPKDLLLRARALAVEALGEEVVRILEKRGRK